MNFTPAQVKNLMRRGLRFIVDPEPRREAKKIIRDHFLNQCAYCGCPLEQTEGDIDHLVSAALGGANGLANRVLSCKPCNAIEKRDRDWVVFLQEKSSSQETFQFRKKTIDSWIEMNGGHSILDPVILAALQEEANNVTRCYDVACKRIRSLKISQ